MPNDAQKVATVGRRISDPADYQPLLAKIGDRQLVLIGEASHGTQEFYGIRADLTQWLIDHKGFRSVAVEADWPDALRVHRYVQGTSDDPDADTALSDFKRFPQWMWRNIVVVEFVEWLRKFNDTHPKSQAGFYGMDLYGLHASIAGVLRYLEKVDPAAALRARQRYACFDHFADPQTYGYAAGTGMAEKCENEAVAQLLELRRRAAEMINRDPPSRSGSSAEAEYFYAEQNARLIANAERYYRSMFRGRASSWNLRDEHMTGTIVSLLTHLNGGRTKIVVWAHNSHLGDARATDMSERGEWNVGQLVRERFGDDAFLIGFTTHHGSVTAASDWDAPAERKRVRPALPESYEKVFHETGIPQFWLDLRDKSTIAAVPERLLERAIGVIYRPETERWSHYFHADLTKQFDVIIHLDETRAVNPLERTPEWTSGEIPETYPSGV
jgi:erythromycin esterase-like protein